MSEMALAACSKHGATLYFRAADGCPYCWREARGGGRSGLETAIQRVTDEIAAKVAPGLPAPKVSFGPLEHGQPVDVPRCPTHRMVLINGVCGSCRSMGAASADEARLASALGVSQKTLHESTWKGPGVFEAAVHVGVDHASGPSTTAQHYVTDEEMRQHLARRDREQRRSREAALVALVNAVPEGFDPVGWRAAVLAASEGSGYPPAVWRSMIHGALAAAFKYGTRRLDSFDDACDEVKRAVSAYRRALAPAPKVQPERRRGGPVVVVDRGEDE